MSSDEFRALLSRDRERALLKYFEAWLDANSESRGDAIRSLAALATHIGVPRIELGDDEDIVAAYDEMVGNDEADETEDTA